MKLQLTLVQMPCVEGNREANYEWARGLLQNHKSSENLEFIVLPELFDVGFRYEDYAKVGPGIPGRTSEFVQDLAEEYSSYVVGTGLEKTEALFFNTLVMASPEGKIIGTYRKIHPFQSERDVFAGGSTATLFDIKGVKIGVEICYDIRFPEVSRKLALEGAELILMPSAFPDPRSAHWDNLVMARAIENQLFMAAANRVGPSFDGKTYFGHSQVVDPWGVRLTRINSENEIFTSRVDTSMIQTVREQITCYADIAPEGYDKVQWFSE
ncbi:MAG: nitrilase-related carbon-nitrogen hydrolase [Candidatus Thorarchaeota archaeon]|jgi:predicted amidohydrolase